MSLVKVPTYTYLVKDELDLLERVITEKELNFYKSVFILSKADGNYMLGYCSEEAYKYAIVDMDRFEKVKIWG